MRSNEEFTAEAIKRAATMQTRRKRRRKRLTAGALLGVCLSLTILIAVVLGRYPVGLSSGAAANQAPLLFPDAGGYVLCGVIAFTLGVAATWFFAGRKA